MQSYCERKGRRDRENTETNIETNATGETGEKAGKRNGEERRTMEAAGRHVHVCTVM